MPKFIDHTGQVFGKITVLSRGPNDKSGHARWNCVCVCGRERLIASKSLSYKGTKSCGKKGKMCREKIHARKPFGVSSRNIHLYHYKRDAKKRGYSWNLSDSHFFKLCLSNCYYCKQPPSLVVIDSRYRAHGAFVCNGVDRVDNSRGYVKGNVVACCKPCNRAKGTMSRDEFIALCHRVTAAHPS